MISPSTDKADTPACPSAVLHCMGTMCACAHNDVGPVGAYAYRWTVLELYLN